MGKSAGGHTHLRALGWLLTEEQVRRLGAADSPGRGQDPREGVLEEVLLRLEGLLEKALESVGFRTVLAQHPNFPQRPDTEHPERRGRRVRVASVKTIRPAPVCAGEGGEAGSGSSPGA